MKFYVHYSTGCFLDADSEESAQAQLCELIKNNIEPGLCKIRQRHDGKRVTCADVRMTKTRIVE